MATRRPKPHLVKKRFSYTIAEIAALQSVHRNTVRAWLKEGVPTISDNCRPILILGHDLADFLSKRRTRNKRGCQPGQLYCLACRQPREPAGAMVDLTIQTPTRGMLAGICPVCDRFMHRAVNPMRVRENCANLTVSETAATAHIYAEIAAGRFVRPVKISVRASAWPRREIDVVISALTGGASSAQLTRIVAELHSQRIRHRRGEEAR